MAFSATARPSALAEMNVTPLVDVMLVLLIIFMVAAPMATVSIKLDLPPPVPNPDQPDEEPIFITIQESGSLFVVDQQTTIETLPADLCAALGGGACQEERLFIRADAEVKYVQFMEVMNELQKNGFLKVGLLNEDIT